MSQPCPAGLAARLVWDGTDEVRIPPEMGAPAPDQMHGTPGERLGELSCRVCYDSLGAGRSSDALHAHILEVAHTSVYEHPNYTVQIDGGARPEYMVPFLNRKGVWLDVQGEDLRVTLNPRVLLDWERHNGRANRLGASPQVRDTLQHLLHRQMPRVVTPRHPAPELRDRARVVEPQDPHEQWISLFLSGSRGLSHEQVRHGDDTGISQRSTRYVEEVTPTEDGKGYVNNYIPHPLILAFLGDPAVPREDREAMQVHIDCARTAAQRTYSALTPTLQRYQTGKGLGKTDARKQARGAARGFLGNALYTEMIFSATVAQWLWMLQMRFSDPADAEIRRLYQEALPVLQASRYGHRFMHLETQPARDGLGLVLTGV